MQAERIIFGGLITGVLTLFGIETCQVVLFQVLLKSHDRVEFGGWPWFHATVSQFDRGGRSGAESRRRTAAIARWLRKNAAVRGIGAHEFAPLLVLGSGWIDDVSVALDDTQQRENFQINSGLILRGSVFSNSPSVFLASRPSCQWQNTVPSGMLAVQR